MSPFNHRTMQPRKKRTGTRGPRLPRTNLYFNGGLNGDWGNLGNWWQNAGLSLPATDLPDEYNNVVLLAAVAQNTGSQPTVHNLSIPDALNDGWTLDVPVTVQGMAYFAGSSSLNADIFGNAAFAETASNAGTVHGNAAFDNSSTNSGTVTGDATVTYPVVRPLGGTVSGSITYLGYPFFLSTEDGFRLTSEAGELLVTEQFA